VIVARSEDKLTELAAEIRTATGRQVHVLVADLTEADAVTELLSQLDERGIEIDHLVNNAGVGRAKAIVKDDPSILTRMIQLNCIALTELTAQLLPRMVQRGRGGILQVASVIGFSPCPYQAAYAATKAYVKSLTEALEVELLGTGVRTSALCPGHVQTGFQKAAGFTDGAMAVPGELSAAVTVRAGLQGYERGKTIVVPGFMNRMAVLLGNLLPRWVIARISARTLQKLGRFD
jgi:short-subunit dehydrogenase